MNYLKKKQKKNKSHLKLCQKTLGINSTKKMKDLYSKNYKTFMKEFKNYMNNYRNILYS